ncbi:ABC transporter permease [Glycomyces niveus]|jgi:putative aldouronate transport system permease protein|uniref:Sugar ABC transporter permease n=1 Tax=Glycomyces niveus TaxID=2820287 RepID=A0ABS3U6T3_9ACTN|nr:ABC transporter permease subunit [Glycomyces sp. NEAU-S30]MBO3734485.1 sugar ABC transporter permease [Glycomyces sp. NEAU-S30]
MTAALDNRAAAALRKRRRGALGRSLRRHWQLYALLVLPVAYFVIFQYIPMANNVIAFKDYNVVQGIWGSPWAGLDHFERFFANPVALDLIRNTLMLSFYGFLAGFPIPIILALALNEVRARFFKRTVQMVTYAPHFISTVIVVSMLILIFSPRIGFMSDFLGFFGMNSNLLADPDAFRSVYVWSDVWQTAGYSAIIYMAALAGIDPSLYEAARLDGASRLRKIWHVDLPGIAPTVVVVMVLSVGNIMAVGFEKAFLLQNPLNLSTSEIIATYTYKIGLLSADFSLATAVGLFNSVINLILLLAVNTVSKRVTGNGLW